MSLTRDLMSAAARLGLAVERDHATGVIDGQRVRVWIAFAGTNSQSVQVRADLERPLDLGVHLGKHVLFGERVVTGNADLDGELTVIGDEPDRVRALFDAGLADHLAALYRSPLEVSLDDGGCTVYQIVGFEIPEVNWLVRALHGAARAVAIIEKARARLPVAKIIEHHAAAIDGIAGKRNLTVGTAPLLATGDFDGCALQMGATRTGTRAYHLFARARIESTLGVGLALRRHTLLDGVRTLFGGQDLALGDAPFDRRFLVRAERPEHVPVLVDRKARSLLLSLDEHFGAVTVDDHTVSVDPIPLTVPLDELIILAELLTEAATRLSTNRVHGGAEGGPYR